MRSLSYLHGLHNELASEALPNTIVPGRNSPQSVPHGLYAEQLSGTAFTVPRALNLRSWLYRIRPSVLRGPFVPRASHYCLGAPFVDAYTSPEPFRWQPYEQIQSLTWLDSLFTMAGHGSPDSLQGAAIHLYDAKLSMQESYFYNADGDFLIVPQEGTLHLRTEMGELIIVPGEIAVLPRGIVSQIVLLEGQARGYVLENYGAPFRLPELGVIGANGLAGVRDFQIPKAAFEERSGELTLIAKYHGRFWETRLSHSPLDVVAWHGNLAPYKYDLRLFNTMNTVSFDHPDPSIFTVLTSPSLQAGVANIDFVIFPSRWMVAEETFRPPYYHRNVMSEFMGLIYGEYDAKQNGFVPGGCSLHNRMVPHGPDATAFQQGKDAKLKPEYYDHTLAFMFESCYTWMITEQAYRAPFREQHYHKCWSTLEAHYQQL